MRFEQEAFAGRKQEHDQVFFLSSAQDVHAVPVFRNAEQALALAESDRIEEQRAGFGRDFVESQLAAAISLDMQYHLAFLAVAPAAGQEEEAQEPEEEQGGGFCHFPSFFALSLAQVSLRPTVLLKINRFSFALSGSTEK